MVAFLPAESRAGHGDSPVEEAPGEGGEQVVVDTGSSCLDRWTLDYAGL